MQCPQAVVWLLIATITKLYCNTIQLLQSSFNRWICHSNV